MSNKIYFLTLGCPKNTVDSENMAFLLQESGFQITQMASEADVVIINTCSFIHDAKEESVRSILELSLLKKDNPNLRIVVTGCLAQRYADELSIELPEVDLFIGTGDIYDIVELLDQSNKIHVDHINRAIIETKRILSTPPYTAYVKIAEGCDKHCTYCIIPQLRGKQRSRKMEDILTEVRSLVKDGVREIILIAQDTGEYGTDIYQERKLFELLNELNKIDRLKWIRVLYVYPETIDDHLIDAIAENKKVLHYIDIPFQHINDNVLLKMGRKTNSDNIWSLVKKLRNRIPDIAIRSTFIVGFPGETPEAFEDLADFLREAELDRVGVFPYSQEEGTAAALMEDQIPESIKQERYAYLMQLQEEVSDKNLAKNIDRVLEILIEERIEPGVYAGRSYLDAPEIDGVVYVHCKGELELGEFYDVVINDAMEYDLIATCIN